MNRLWRVCAFVLIGAVAIPSFAQHVRTPRSARMTGIPVVQRSVVEQAVTMVPVNAAAPCSEVEPNELTSQATPMLIPSTCSGSVSSTDAASIKVDYGNTTAGIQDVFLLNLPAATQPTIDLSYSSASADLDLFLFNVTTDNRVHFVASATHDAPGSAEHIAMLYSVAPGTYYVGVSAYTGSTPYTLQISAPGYSETCTPETSSLCLSNGRFRVQADYRTAGGDSGKGQGVLLTGDTGYFWFFNAANVEVVLKVLDACSFNSKFWVYSGGMTDVNVKLTVTDTVTGATKTYENAAGTAFKTITDSSAFATCSPASCTYAVSPSSQSFAASGGTGSVAVTTTAGCAWTATASDSWITITGGASGTGNGTVSYSVAANTATSSRSGSLAINGQSVTITQSGATASCTYTVSPSSLQFAGSGGSATVNVTTQSGCTWTATTGTSWLSITSGSSGTGNGTVSVSAQASSAASSRTGSLTIAGKTVTVNQDAGTSNCSYQVSYTPRDFTWCGGDATYSMTKTEGCSFNVTTSAPWIQPNMVESGTSTSAFGSFMVAANDTGSSRQGTITIATQTYTISQPARSTSGTYDGLWSGTTGSGRSFAACVAGGAVQMFRPTVSLNGGTFTCTTPIVAMSPLSISGTAFTGTAQAYPEISNVSAAVTGSFTSSTAMSGSWSSNSGSGWFVWCGDRLAIISGSSPLSSGTFTATKQP